MLVAVINDTHFGARQDSDVLLRIQEKFYSKVFFKTLEENNIKVLLHLGDLFDRRKGINFLTLKKTREIFLEPLKKLGVQMHIIPGNHDTYHKNNNVVNSLDLLLQEYDNIHVYSESTKKLKFGNTSFLLCPWLAIDNQLQLLKEINDSSADVLAGHFALKGFEISRGSYCTSGLEPDIFSKFDMVWSGHFHIPSKKGNVEYLGAPYEMDWGDQDGVRGFHIFNTESKELRRVFNPFQLHQIIYYDDEDMTIEDLNEVDFKNFTGCFVRVSIKKRSNMKVYDLFMKKLESAGPADLKVVDDIVSISQRMNEEVENLEVKDTRKIMHEYVDGIETKVSKDNVKSMMDDLFREAVRISN